MIHHRRPHRTAGFALLVGALALAGSSAEPLDLTPARADDGDDEPIVPESTVVRFGPFDGPWGSVIPKLTVERSKLDLELWIPGQGRPDPAMGGRRGGWRLPPDAEVPPHPVPEGARVSVRGHRADGSIVLPAEGEQLPFMTYSIGMSGHITDSATAHGTLPFVGDLEELWIEVRIGEGEDEVVRWLEVPYGYGSDPTETDGARPELGAPKGPPAAARAGGATPSILPWGRVDYDLGEIQNGWRLQLWIANPFDAQGELTLYKDDNRMGRQSWDLHDPKTSVRAVLDDGGTLRGSTMAIRRHEDGMRRSDAFSFNRSPGDARCWADLEVTVGDEAYRIRVPSSLVRYVHGHGEESRALVQAAMREAAAAQRRR